MSIAQKCKIDGCTGLGFISKNGRRSFTKGFCISHYQNYRKHGDPLYAENRRKSQLTKCSVKECEVKPLARGMCGKHYIRYKKYGDPNYTKISMHGMYYHPLYTTWSKMKERCYNENHQAYGSYGGRGIKVCDRWLNNFANFVNDMGEKPEGTTLDRINNNEGYTPSNCRWATLKQQSRNRRSRSGSSSTTRGVYFNKERSHWRASIRTDGRMVYLGSYATEEEAVVARKDAEKKYWLTS